MVTRALPLVDARITDAVAAGHLDEATRPAKPSRWAQWKWLQDCGTVPGWSTTILSDPGKMPCPSYSIPAGHACPGAYYGPGGVCAHCYAMDANYLYPTVRRAQARRFAWTRAAMKTEEGRAYFTRRMIEAIHATQLDWFRIHDSGDLFSPEYTACWARIAEALPGVRMWAPTRMWRFLERPRWGVALADLNGQPNVTLRPSALLFVGEPEPTPEERAKIVLPSWYTQPLAEAPIIPGWPAGTQASAHDYDCPAPSQGNQCLECRRCWLARDEVVTYHKQG